MLTGNIKTTVIRFILLQKALFPHQV